MTHWPDLQILHAIVSAGSLAGAGRMLGVRHTTVGRRLDDLERAVGGKLVDRMPRGAILTPLGQELAGVAAAVDEMMAAAQRRSRGEPGEIRGAVSITAAPFLAAGVLAPGLAPLLARHPALTVIVESNPSVASLSRSEADIALRLGNPTEPSLLSRRLGDVRLGLYATPEVRGRPQEEWRFVGASPALSHLPHHHWFEEFVGARTVAFRSNDLEARREAAARGVGVAILPCITANDDPRLERIDEHEPPTRPLWLLVHPDIRRAVTVGVLIDHLVELFAKDPRIER